jgi:hypothetical protein
MCVPFIGGLYAEINSDFGPHPSIADSVPSSVVYDEEFAMVYVTCVYKRCLMSSVILCCMLGRNRSEYPADRQELERHQSKATI